LTKRISTLKDLFLAKYKDEKTELEYKNDYELLICIILSAQCTDKRVNIITPSLFSKYPNIKCLKKANLDDVKELIKTCSFFNNKASNLIKMANRVNIIYDGKIPKDEKSLISLAGVGQKTAHVFLGEFYEENYMAVDTHVYRISHRLRFSHSKSLVKTEEDLVKLFKTDLANLHQAFVLFGRYICKAQKPLCQKCFIYDFCRSKDKIKQV